MNGNISDLITEAQNTTFQKKAADFVEGKDLNIKGYSLADITHSPFVLGGLDAIKNKVILWLTSDPGDYIREPEKGAPISSLLGKPMTESYASSIERSIRTTFQDMFQGELSLFDVSVQPDMTRRLWIIRMVVQDLVRRELFTIDIGVS